MVMQAAEAAERRAALAAEAEKYKAQKTAMVIREVEMKDAETRLNLEIENPPEVCSRHVVGHDRCGWVVSCAFV